MATFLLLLLAGCGDDGGMPDDASDGDAADAMLPPPIQFTADPDPDEVTTCTTAPPAAGEVRAKHVVCEEELVTGSIAMGRVGDLMIENARVRFIIRGGEESAAMIGNYAGGIVDAAPHGGSDLLKELFPGIGLSTPRPERIVVADAGDEGTARIRLLFVAETFGLLAGAAGSLVPPVNARGVIDYELRPDEDALRIRVQLTAQDTGPTAQGPPGVYAILGGAAELVQPGNTVISGDGDGGPGLPIVIGEGPSSAIAVRMMADNGSVEQLDTIFGLLAGETLTVRRGEMREYEARIAVASNAFTAWNAVHAGDDGLARLIVDGEEDGRVEVALPSGAPLLRTRLDGGGRASVDLPTGSYRVRSGFASLVHLRYGSFFEGTPADVTLAAGGAMAAPAPAPRGTLNVTATAGGAADAPVRVTVEAGSGGAELGRFVAIGPSSFALPPASYRVTVSRGMEHDVFQQDVELLAGATADVTAVLDRVVDTTGWVAGDFHLHSEASTDSFHAIDNALRIMAGEGLEVVASTDHDYINDYALRTAAAGVDGWLVTVNGIEISHPFIAHIGSYPARRDTARAGAGAPVWFEMNHSELLDAARSIGDPALGGALVQLNHPRRDRNGLFQWMELDPVTLMAGATPESLGLPADTVLEDFDFDVIEIVNKSPDDEDDRTLVDYLALYAMGHRFTGMGNSDSHSPNDSNIAGSPRTYVRVPDDARGAFTWDDVAASLRSQAVTLGGGIFVTAEIAGPVASGMLPLAVQVQAAPWVDVDQVVVYAGTGMALTVPVTGTGVTRLDETLMVPVGTASFVLVRAEGDRAMPPALRFEPFGMTNPIDIPGR